MDKNKIIEQYNATDVIVSNDFIEWLRRIAGETGAVWITRALALLFGLKIFAKWRQAW